MADGKKTKTTKKTKEPKCYKVVNADGKVTVQMTEKGTDGRYHSFVVYTPCMVRGADGKMKKATLKEIVRDALKEMICFYPNLAADGKGK